MAVRLPLGARRRALLRAALRARLRAGVHWFSRKAIARDSAARYAAPAQAMRDLLGWLSQRYNVSILITENGVSAPGRRTGWQRPAGRARGCVAWAMLCAPAGARLPCA